jgi:ubiquinone/menaquinone biosynthesis C-methylase UbiE
MEAKGIEPLTASYPKTGLSFCYLLAYTVFHKVIFNYNNKCEGMSVLEYFGIFKQIRELNMPNSVDLQFYDGYYSKLYQSMSQHQDYDLAFILEHASITGGPILELACGAGRITMNIAKSGYKVTGVDLSKDMLQLSEQKKSELPLEMRDNVLLIHEDITQMQLNQTFSLAVFSETSMSILKNTLQLDQMLQTVYNHLCEGGLFVLDYLIPSKYQYSIRDGRVAVITNDISQNEKEFIIIGEMDLDGKTALVNFYSEVVHSERTSRYFGTTLKTYFTEEDMTSAIKKAGFTISKEIKKARNDENIIVLVLEK